NLNRRTHGIVESRGLRLVDQPHRALAHLLLGQKSVVGARDHVDDRVADAEDIESRRGHAEAPTQNARALQRPNCSRQSRAAKSGRRWPWEARSSACLN